MAPCAACGSSLSGRATLCPVCRVHWGADDRPPAPTTLAAPLPAMESDLAFTEVRLVDPRRPTGAEGSRARGTPHVVAIAFFCAAVVIMLAAALAALKS